MALNLRFASKQNSVRAIKPPLGIVSMSIESSGCYSCRHIKSFCGRSLQTGFQPDLIFSVTLHIMDNGQPVWLVCVDPEHIKRPSS